MAKKKKFHFNPHTLNYEQIEHTLGYRIKRFSIQLFIGLLFGTLFFFVFSFIIESPQTKQLNKTNKKLLSQYKLLELQLHEFEQILDDIQQRDDNLYRVIFQADPISKKSRKSITANSKYYDELLKQSQSDIVVSTTKKTKEIKKQLYVQSQSFDEVVDLLKENKVRLLHIPAIQPVLNKDLKRMASGYGWRIHPIYNVRKFHSGMDFSAPIGTDIYATGNGTVTKVGWRQGYGKAIEINHGYGYVTLYAHLSETKVKGGQKVKRGDVIGLVGNTGQSKGPHLHYEVLYKGKHQNPNNFYFLDLSPEEYDLMVQMSNNAGQVLD